MKVDYNPYEGREVTGATDTVISRGRVHRRSRVHVHADGLEGPVHS